MQLLIAPQDKILRSQPYASTRKTTLQGNTMAQNLTKSALLSTSSLVFGLLVAAPVMAQDTIDLGTVVLGESKRDVQTDTATPVTEIDQEEIDDRQAGTIGELIDSVPGVSLVNGASPQSSGISIRGFGANGTYGNDQKVAIQVDGASMGSEELYRIGTQLYTDPELYKSLSVIRGAVGTFAYGSGIVGGVVQLETKDASDFTGGEVGFVGRQALEFTSNGDGIAGSTILAWQPSESVEFLMNYTFRQLGIQEDGDGELIAPDQPEIEMPSGLLKARYSFGENNEQALTLSYTDTRTDERDVPYNAFTGVSDFFGNVNRETHNVTTSLRYEYNPVGNDLINLDVNLSYADQEIWNENALGEGATYAILDADHRYQTTKLRIANTSLFQTGTVDHSLLSGVELTHKERLDAASAPGGTDDRIAVFAVDEAQFGDSLTLTAALRAESQKVQGDTAPNDATYENDAVMGGLSAHYKFESGFAVFGSAAYTVGFPIMDDLGNADYMTQPEQAETFEIGASFDNYDVFADGDSIAIKATAYQTTVWDVTSYSGADKVELEGLELEASYSLESGFYVDANANIVDGSEYAGSISGTWRNLTTDTARVTLGKKFGEELDLSFETVTSIKRAETEQYTVNNLRATYLPQSGVMEGTEIRVGIENVFDETYQPILALRNAPGRNVKLTLARTF